MVTADEDPFDLIKKGNAFESCSDHWRSAEFYSRASTCLHTRADELSSQIRKGGQVVVDDASYAEKMKVVSLFRAQSLEYLYKARHCLLEALRFENDQDRSRTLEVAKSGTGSLDPLFSMISQEESEKRKLIFNRLFSGGGEAIESDNERVEVGTQAGASEESGDESKQIDEGKISESTHPDTSSNADSSQIDTSENVKESSPQSDEIDDRQQSIESRLAQLDSSLLPKVPPPFISGSRSSGGDDSQNRLEEIQRGLKGLGVSLPESNGKKDLIPEKLSPEDQVKLIIQQAKDEVLVNQGLHVGGGAQSNGLVDATEMDDDDMIDENDSMFEGFEDEDYDIDALLSKAESLVAKTGIGANGEGKFSSELVQIRKVQALLLEARLCLEMEQAKSTNETETLNNPKNMSDEESGECEDSVENDQSASGSKLAARKKAKELIENAQDCMKKILNEWK